MSELTTTKILNNALMNIKKKYVKGMNGTNNSIKNNRQPEEKRYEKQLKR